MYPVSIHTPEPGTALKTIKREFRSEQVALDFHTYESCTFVGCELVYHGYTGFNLINCNFQNCRISLTGPAGAGLQFLSVFRNSGDPGARSMTDQILQSARLA